MTITDFGVAVVEGDTHLSKWIIEQRRLDVAREYLLQFQKYIPLGGVVVDAGACLGDHTAPYSQFVGPSGTVLAFEPNPTAFECLKHNMKAYENVTVFNLGLGAFPGVLGIKSNDNLGMARLTAGGAGQISVVTLDSFNLGKLDFMKMDVEGFEPQVIAGARETLRRCRPVLLVEIQKECLLLNGCTAEDVISPLRELGYNVIPAESHLTLDMPQLDVLCLPI